MEWNNCVCRVTDEQNATFVVPTIAPDGTKNADRISLKIFDQIGQERSNVGEVRIEERFDFISGP